MKRVLSVLLSVILVMTALVIAPASAGALNILGDVDGDGEVTILDATAIQRKLAGIAVSDFFPDAADADGDGELTILDATAIQRWLAGLPSNENIGSPLTQPEPEEPSQPGDSTVDEPADEPGDSTPDEPGDSTPDEPGEHPDGRVPYDGEVWLDKSVIKMWDEPVEDDMIISAIYADCFFAWPVAPLPVMYKINGSLSEEWCVGDQVLCTYTHVYYDTQTDHIEGDLVDIVPSTYEPGPEPLKPVIYLYPEEETEVSVRLDLNGEFYCTYPDYGDGWHVTASPDGTLTDDNGMTYNYLYWEGRQNTRYDFSEGFCVKGSDTAAFLEWALDRLGLTRREANEFIVYWLPQMQKNPYNVISFQGAAYTDTAPLEITPAPDTLIRVFMAWYPSDDAVSIPAQPLTAPAREGFTVIEWGGAVVK